MNLSEFFDNLYENVNEIGINTISFSQKYKQNGLNYVKIKGIKIVDIDKKVIERIKKENDNIEKLIKNEMLKLCCNSGMINNELINNENRINVLNKRYNKLREINKENYIKEFKELKKDLLIKKIFEIIEKTMLETIEDLKYDVIYFYNCNKIENRKEEIEKEKIERIRQIEEIEKIIIDIENMKLGYKVNKDNWIDEINKKYYVIIEKDESIGNVEFKICRYGE